MESVLGNHDIFGWNKKKSGAKGDDAKYGKAWALETLGLSKPYHSFDKNGWHFVALDSVQPTGADGSEEGKDIYLGKIDDEQFEWLVADLQNVGGKLPVCVLSHIPIFSAAAFLSREEKNADWNVPAALMLTDGRKLQNLFVKHPNVKLCVSGHLHLVDYVEYSGVSYLCNGAVCGGWWKGKHRGFDAGYALLDLYDDGSFEREFVNYGWKPRTA
jgi:3',5'-cyclic-AMP phosphodiesterase